MEERTYSEIPRPRKDYPQKKNRKSISLATKLQVLDRIESGQRAARVARQMGLPQSTVRTIYKDADRIRECCENATCLSSKIISRKRSKIMERLEFELCQWIDMMVERSVEVSMAMIQQRALEIFQVLKNQEPDDSADKKERFTASRGWFDRFRKRQNLHASGSGYEKVAIGYDHDSEFQDMILPEDHSNNTENLSMGETHDLVDSAHEFLDFQMFVAEDDSGGNSEQHEGFQKFKMCEARTSMIDLQVDPLVLSDPNKRSKVFQDIEEILQQYYLKRKYEDTFGQSHIVIFSNECGSLTAIIKTYPFGLVTLTLEDSLEENSFTNMKMEDLRKIMLDKMKVKIEKIPIIKRGAAVPVYFTTADERILEYDFDKTIFEADSQYQNIKILHSPTLGNCLMLDDLQNLAESDLNYTQGVMKYGAISYDGKEVLILGGGDGGLLHELLKEAPKYVTMVDIDQMVIDACRIHLRGCCGDSLDKLEGSNYQVIIDDCFKKLDEYKNEGRKFDVIINDLTDIPIATSPQGELWEFVRKILIKSLAVLKDDGIYLNHALGEGCVDSLQTYENVLSALPEKVKFESHAAYVPSFMENWVFYEVRKVRCQ